MKLAIGIPVIFAATALLFVYLWFIWWLDRYEREPFWLVALVFLWGATIGIGCGCAINSTVLLPVKDVLSPGATTGFAAIVVAPVVEELTKGLVFIPLLTTYQFDNETDGLIYGAATGLGFALVENLLYFVQFVSADQMSVGMMIVSVAIRALFTAVMHCISSAMLGMAVGYARHRAETLKWFIYPGIGYVLAVGNHSAWNAAAFLSNVHAGFQLAGIGLVVLGGAILFGLTQYSLKREHDVIRKYLLEEADRGTLPAEHAEIIPYWTKRRRNDWLAPEIPKEPYVEAATRLAFRHHQRELAPEHEHDDYADDIKNFRTRIRDLLTPKTT